jgi:hypothetical protein
MRIQYFASYYFTSSSFLTLASQTPCWELLHASPRRNSGLDSGHVNADFESGKSTCGLTVANRFPTFANGTCLYCEFIVCIDIITQYANGCEWLQLSNVYRRIAAPVCDQGLFTMHTSQNAVPLQSGL